MNGFAITIGIIAALSFLLAFSSLWGAVSLRNLVDIGEDIANLKREQTQLMRHQLFNDARGDKLAEDVKQEYLRSREKNHA